MVENLHSMHEALGSISRKGGVSCVCVLMHVHACAYVLSSFDKRGYKLRRKEKTAQNPCLSESRDSYFQPSNHDGHLLGTSEEAHISFYPQPNIDSQGDFCPWRAETW